VSKVYRRRQIESNWEKYEEEAASTGMQSDVAAHAPADYEELLKATCAFVSQLIKSELSSCAVN